MLPIKNSRLNDHKTEAKKKLRWVIGGVALAYCFIVLALSTAWYSDQMLQPFHFFNDLPEWKQTRFDGI